MILGHADTPLHDDPALLGWAQVAGGLGVAGTASFALYAARCSLRERIRRRR